MLKIIKLNTDEVLDYLNLHFKDILNQIDKVPVFVTFAFDRETNLYTVIFKFQGQEITGYQTESKAKLSAFVYNSLVEYNEEMAEDTLEKIDTLLP